MAHHQAGPAGQYPPSFNRRQLAATALATWALARPAAAAPSAQPPGRGDFPDVVLRNQDGRPVRFYDDLVQGDHTVAINFIYTRCTRICQPATANLAMVQDLLGDRIGRQVRMASVSVDPRRDTPAVLKAYAQRFGAAGSWQFLTGEPRDVERLRRGLGAFERDPALDSDRSQHTGMVVFGNQARGRWSRVSALADPRRIADSLMRWT